MTKKRPALYRDEVDKDMNDNLKDMICDIGVDYFKKGHVYHALQVTWKMDKEQVFPLSLGTLGLDLPSTK